MTYICLVIDAHQPIRLNRTFPYERVKRIAEGAPVMDRYFDDKLNQQVFTEFSKNCYTPTFKILLETIDSTYELEKPFKLSFCLSGLFIEQAIKYEPDLIELLKKLVATKNVEILGGDYYHSLASICQDGMNEFIKHVKFHHQIIKKLFGVEPNVFENTELIYNNSVAKAVKKFGYEGILTEGVGSFFSRNLPTYVYSSPGDQGLKLLFRHYKLSDDLRFRFSKKTWNEYPLTANKYCNWLSATPGDVILIALEIETFGGNNSVHTGIFDFLKKIPEEVANRENLEWNTPTDVIKNVQSSGTLIIPDVRTISHENEKKSTNPWLENSMQRISFDRIFNLRPYIEEINDANIMMIWRLLQQSDHLSYMSTRKDQEGRQSHHSYYSSPAEAFAVFDAVNTDFEGKIAIIVQNIRKSKLRRLTSTTKPLHPSTSQTQK